jgi:hypothetical protein
VISASGVYLQQQNALITRKRLEMNEDNLNNSKSKLGSAYQMVLSLLLGGATYLRFPLPVCFTPTKNDRNSKTGRAISNEHVVTFVAFANKLLSVINLRYFTAYIHVHVIRDA